MDVNGAKALQKRLGPNRSPEPQTVPATVSELAPPVYHWFGVEQPGARTIAHTADETRSPIASRSGLLGWFGLRRR